MADYSSYVPGYMAARSVWDQGIAPVAKRAQNYLKGLAQIPPSVGNYAMETLQSELGPTTQLGVDAFKLGHTMREGIKEDPLRAVAEMYPPVGTASDLFESTRLMNMADEAEKMGDLEKANTLRGLGTTLPLLGIIPGLYHASPHIFDKFSTRHIGSGEGAQAYGHGLYFAENPKVASGTYKNPEGSYARLSGHMEPKTEMAYDLLEKGMGITEVMGEMVKKYGPDVSFDDVSRAIDEARDKYNAGTGHLYNVDLNVEPDELLDWDAPLSGQSEKVKRAIADLVEEQGPYGGTVVDADWVTRRFDPQTSTGGGFMNLLENKYRRDFPTDYKAKAAEEMASRGIPGIRYYDAGSREAGEGTRNYVIFDDSVIDIRTRNGEPLTPVEREIAVEEMTPQTAGPRTPQEVDEVMESLERANQNRARRIEETGLPYVPNKEPPLPEYRRSDPYEPEADRRQRERTLARERRKQEEERRQQESDARREPPPTPQEPSPTVQEALFGELDLSPAARAARATEQGWSGETLYHGTAADIDEFDPSLAGSTTTSSSAKLGTWLTSDPTVASGYARFAAEDAPVSRLVHEATLAENAGNFDLHEQLMREAERLEFSGEVVGAGGQNVMPLRVRGNLMEVDAEGQTFAQLTDGQLMRWATEAKKQGYDGLKVKDFSDNPDWGNYRAADHYLIFEPKNIRSVNAHFDPARMHEADLQAGIASLGATEGTA